MANPPPLRPTSPADPEAHVEMAAMPTPDGETSQDTDTMDPLADVEVEAFDWDYIIAACCGPEVL